MVIYGTHFDDAYCTAILHDYGVSNMGILNWVNLPKSEQIQRKFYKWNIAEPTKIGLIFTE